MKKYLGIDVGGTKVKYGVYDSEGNEHATGIINTEKDDLSKFVNNIVTIANEYKDIEGIGLSLPSVVNSETGEILDAGNVQVLAKVNLKKILGEKVNLKVEIENDANCVGLAEKWIGNGKGHKNFVCITLGTGIGGAVFIDNKLYNGTHNFGGEFGYIIIKDPLQKPRAADFGNIASTNGLIRMVANKKGVSVSEVDGYKIFKALEDGDKEVEESYREWLTYLAVGIGNVCYALDPEKVLIGGGISSVERLLVDLKSELNDILPEECRIWNIDVCKHFNDSGKLGAIYSFMEKHK